MMIALFLMLAIIAGKLILPGWYWANKRQSQSIWLFFLPMAGLVLWVLLTVLVFGAQCLANAVETPVIAGVAVLAVYLKVFAFDKNSSGTGIKIIKSVYHSFMQCFLQNKK